ncbi:MAG: hypothetical protein ACTHK7_04865, partial [Aureliella sp.]
TPIDTPAWVGVEIDWNNDSQADATVPIADDGTFQYTATALAAGAQTVQVRSKAYDGVVKADAYGPWASLSFTYEPLATPQATLHLLVDDGESSTDNVSSISTLTGVVSPLDGQDILVEFDTNGDGTADGSAIPQSDGQFIYRPVSLAVGSVTAAARVQRFNPYLETTEIGPWTTVTFTLAPPNTTPLSLSNLRLAVDTGINTSDRVTTNPTLTASILGGAIADKVEIDLDGNGTADTTSAVRSDGTFRFTPIGMSLGTHVIGARAVGYDYSSGARTEGPWSMLDFTLVQSTASVPTIETLGLLSDSGTEGDGLTENPAIIGTIADDGSVARVTIQVDTNNDGTVDATVFTDNSGVFLYQPVDPTLGAHTISFRTTEFAADSDEQLLGAWHSVSFTLQDQVDEAPRLYDVSFDAASIGKVPSISGRVGYQHSVEKLGVEIDVNDDGTPDVFAVTDEYGKFNAGLTGLADGTQSISIRTRAISDEAGAVLVGQWQTYSVNYSRASISPAAITWFALVNDDGTSSSDNVTTDARLRGQVDRAAYSSFLTIELDMNGDGVVDGHTLVQPDLSWTYTPQNVPVGPAVARARTKDYAPSGEVLRSDWSSLSFTLQSADTSSLRVANIALANDTGASSNDRSTSVGAITGAVLGQQGSTMLIVEVDQNGDGKADGSVQTWGSSFYYTPSGLLEGWVELQVRVRTSDSSQSSSWTSFGFVYDSDPDSADAQALVSAYSSFNTSNQNGSDAHDASLITANDTLTGSRS